MRTITVSVSREFSHFVRENFPLEKRKDIYAKMKVLEKFPEMYRRTRWDLRELIFDNILILYRFDEEENMIDVIAAKFDKQARYE